MKLCIFGLLFVGLVMNCQQAKAIQVFIIAGQSNAEGGALITTATAANQAAYTADYAPVTYSYHYENAPNPDVAGAFGALRTDSGYHGMEVSLGRELDAVLVGDVAIIKYTAGGSNLHTDWNPTLNNLYDDFITHVNAEIATLASTHATVDVQAMFWHQGESDADELPAQAYEANLMSFFNSVRVDLSEADLKFVAGKISETSGWATGNDWEDDINDAIQSAADGNSHISTFATADDISMRSDGGLFIHFDSDGNVELGKRMAASYLQAFVVPEPGSELLLGCALVLGLVRRRRA